MFFCVKKRALTKNSTKVFGKSNLLFVNYLCGCCGFERKKMKQKSIFFVKKFVKTKKSFKFALA
jgi:hypothetical protein